MSISARYEGVDLPMKALHESVLQTAGVDRDVVVINSRGVESTTWSALRADAVRAAAALQTTGDLSPGARVAALGETSVSLLTVIYATWLSGATLTVLPMPGRARSEASFLDQVRTQLEALTPAVVIGEAAWLRRIGLSPTPSLSYRVVEFEGLDRMLARTPESAWEPPDHDSERLGLLQFTSGSTAAPKAVMVPERCLWRNVAAIRDGLQLDPQNDTIMSWLPLYHDMGLIGMLALGMYTGTRIVLADSATFASRPSRWMEWMSEYQATISCAPNFAYSLAARTLESSANFDLRRWRVAINGAEPIDVRSLQRFEDAAERCGYSRDASFCVFGLAEATLAVTFPKPGTGLQIDCVNRKVLQGSDYAQPLPPSSTDTRLLAHLGRPIDDFRLRVRRRDGILANDREVGELEIMGSCVTPGCLDGPALPSDGWLRTGDLGYMVGGQLVICGRRKDIIIVGGRNLFPEDIERVVAEVDHVRAGNVAAFRVDLNAGEAVVVAAEHRNGAPNDLQRRIRDAVREQLGINPYDVVLLEPGMLPKTSSGKLQRSLCAARYTNGALTDPPA